MQPSNPTSSKNSTLFFFAGEASGDQHGSELIHQLKRLHPQVKLLGWGGDKMQEAGMELLSHYRDRAIMGLVEVIKNFRTIRGFMQQAKRDIQKYRPEKVVFIDNPGFNLPLAKFAKKLGIEVHWYIAPKAWAWNERRVKTMRKCIDHLYVIFPFEPDFFASRGMKSVYVGNPTLESVVRYRKLREEHQIGLNHNHSKTHGEFSSIALLAGSRKAEVASLLPVFIKTALRKLSTEGRSTGGIRIAAAPGLSQEFYRDILERHQLLDLWETGRIKIEFDNTFNILHETAVDGGFALVASGTATLETALLGCPQIVAYQVNPLTYWVASKVLKIQYVSLVNILLKRLAVEEHLKVVSEDILLAAIERLESNRERVLKDYRELEAQLQGESGEFASERVARLIVGV